MKEAIAILTGGGPAPATIFIVGKAVERTSWI